MPISLLSSVFIDSEYCEPLKSINSCSLSIKSSSTLEPIKKVFNTIVESIGFGIDAIEDFVNSLNFLNKKTVEETAKFNNKLSDFARNAVDVEIKATQEYEKTYNVLSSCEYNLSQSISLIASRIYKFENNFDILGDRNIALIDKLSFSANRKFKIENNYIILGERKYSLNRTKELVASKITNLDDKRLIKGNKDITEILIAIDAI